MIRRTLLLLALLSSGGALHAQTVDSEPASSAPSSTRAEILFGVGGGGGGLALAFGPRFHTSAGLIALRINGMGAFVGEGTSLGDLGLTYGVALASGDAWITAAAGPAFAWRIARRCAPNATGSFGFCQRYRSESAGAAGLVLQGIVGLGPVSLGVHSNLNGLQSFHAVTVNLHFGAGTGWR